MLLVSLLDLPPSQRYFPVVSKLKAPLPRFARRPRAGQQSGASGGMSLGGASRALSELSTVFEGIECRVGSWKYFQNILILMISLCPAAGSGATRCARSRRCRFAQLDLLSRIRPHRYFLSAVQFNKTVTFQEIEIGSRDRRVCKLLLLKCRRLTDFCPVAVTRENLTQALPMD